MKVVNPYSLSLDGLNLATVSHNIEVVTGLKVVPERRSAQTVTASRHGSEDADEFFGDRTLRLQVTMFPNGEDGSAAGPAVAELHANWDRLVAVVAKRGSIDVRHRVPAAASDESSSSSSSLSGSSSGSDTPDGLVELQGDGKVLRSVVVEGDARVWTAVVELVFRWPFWHELPKVVVPADTGHEFYTGGTAPVANMVFRFAADGMVTDKATGHSIGVSGMSGAEAVIDVRRRKVFEDGNLATGLFRRGVGTPDYWMEWPARTNVELEATSPVAVEFWRSRF